MEPKFWYGFEKKQKDVSRKSLAFKREKEKEFRGQQKKKKL